MIQGLGAQKAGLRIAAEQIQNIQDDATNPRLKQALEEGTDTPKRWADQMDQALKEVAGDGDAGSDDNPIMKANVEVARRMRTEAKDDYSRDLGIVAAGQLSLHYWIAAFGTMHSYGEKLGMSTLAKNMGEMVQEAKKADEVHTELAKVIMAG